MSRSWEVPAPAAQAARDAAVIIEGLVVGQPAPVVEAVLAAELAEFVKGRMAGYKRPRVFLDVAAIPRLPNGKADYKAAKALAEPRP